MKRKKPVFKGKIRKATIEDARVIHKLINECAKRKGDFMLPRPLSGIYENIRDYFVCVTPSKKIIGCVGLRVTWEDLAEIKSLAVIRAYQGRRIGARLVEAALDEAIMMKISRVFTLTIKPDFFIKCGFKPIDKEKLPHKVWGECVNCCFFPDCEEEALVIEF